MTMNSSQILTSHLALPMLLALVYLSFMLRAFSRRLGEVTKMNSYYRWFYPGTGLLIVAALSYTILNNAALTGRPKLVLTPIFMLTLFHLPFTLGILLTLGVALRYWGWLIHKS